MPKVNTIKMESWNWRGEIPNKTIPTDYVRVDNELYIKYSVSGKLKNKTIYVCPFNPHFSFIPEEKYITDVNVSKKEKI